MVPTSFARYTSTYMETLFWQNQSNLQTAVNQTPTRPSRDEKEHFPKTFFLPFNNKKTINNAFKRYYFWLQKGMTKCDFTLEL